MREPFGSPILRLAVRLLSPFIFLYALYVHFHGHVSPGGGFQGGVILAAGLVLLQMVSDPPRRAMPRSSALALAAAGVLIYGGTGLWALLAGGNFLDYAALPLGRPPAELRYLGILSIETGVFITVAGSLVLIYDELLFSER